MQTIDVLHLVRAKGRHHVVARPPRRRPEGHGRAGAQSRTRPHKIDHHLADHVVRVRTGSVQAAPDGLGDAIVHERQVMASGGIEMIEAQRHRPDVGCGLPHKLRVTERPDKRVGLSRDLFELCAEGVDF
jgi:hypothetical protein